MTSSSRVIPSGRHATMPRFRCWLIMPPARRPPPSTSSSRWKFPAGSCANTARPSASMAAKCARATSPCCLPTRPPARVRRRLFIRGGSARSFRPAPTSVGALLKKPPGFPACMHAVMRRSCASKPPSKISRGSTTLSASLPVKWRRSRARRARRCGTAIFPRRCGAPRPYCFICAGLAPAAKSRTLVAARMRPSASSRHGPASTLKPRPGRRKPPPLCPPCARPKPKPPRRRIRRGEPLEREEARAKERIPEPDPRTGQFPADLARERALAAAAEAALGRLDAEEKNLRDVARKTDARLSGANAQVSAAESSLAQSEKSFAELTGALADLTARRNQLQAAVREHEQRADRLVAELGDVDAGVPQSPTDPPHLPTF